MTARTENSAITLFRQAFGAAIAAGIRRNLAFLLLRWASQGRRRLIIPRRVGGTTKVRDSLSHHRLPSQWRSRQVVGAAKTCCLVCVATTDRWVILYSLTREP